MMTRHTRRAATALTALLSTALLAAPALGAPGSGATPDPQEATDGQLLLVLDASGSMGEPDQGGKPKIESARAALDSVIDGLGDDQRVGLRLLASTESEPDTAAACADSELVVPVGTGNQAALNAAVEDYEAFGGETPIGYALQEASQDLGSEGQRSILLVSDGISTCDPDPCEVAEDLTEDGIDLAIHVVGFDVDSAAREQLRCIAEAGNGTYIDAADTKTLTSALTQASTRAFRPFSITGEPVEGTVDPAGAPTLVAGQYTDHAATSEQVNTWYRIQRTTPGSTLHVGLTMRPEQGGTSSYQLYLQTPDGSVCAGATGMPWGAGMSNTFGTAGLRSTGYNRFEGPCQESDELLLRVKLGGGSEPIFGTPVEIVVLEDGPITNRDELPGMADMASWEEMQPGEPVGAVVAGASLTDAPLIEPGQTYSSELTRGEIVFFRVPVDYGQRLQALAEFGAPQGALADTMGAVSDIVDIEIISPSRGEVDNSLANMGDLSTREILHKEQSAQVAATTDEVRWANRGSGTDQGAASLAGDYYVAVSLTSSKGPLLPVPFTITTAALGEPSGFPEYADASSPGDVTEATSPAGQTRSDEGAATAAPDGAGADQGSVTGPDTAAAPPVEARDDGTSSGLILGLAALGLALLGAGGFVLAQVMRT